MTQLLEEAYVPFTEEEITSLKNIPAVLMGREWFMDYDYALDTTSETKETFFYNPTTLENNHFLHAWKVFSTSPFENAVVFTPDTPAVTSVVLSPAESTISAGLTVQLTPVVETTGFANKAVTFEVTKAVGEITPVTVTNTGLVTIPSDFPSTGDAPQVEITATSVFDNTKTGTATITVL